MYLQFNNPMKIQTILPLAAILVLTALYLLGAAAVPFHPDEATQIFMSSDFENLFAQPSSLFYSLSPADPLRQNYRLLDAPLSRWLIGAGRFITGQPALNADWDWSKSWQQNESARALPSTGLLRVSRIAVAWLFAVTLFLGYRTGIVLGGTVMGWLMIVFVSINALVLLHARRAMAESALLFTVTWFAHALAKKETRPLLLVLPPALAVNAKQTAAGLVLIALLAVWMYSSGHPWRKRLSHVLQGALLILLVSYALNPVAWKNPAATARAALAARSELAERQVETIRAVSPELLMQSPLQRAAGWLVYLFISEPAVADVANYINDTRASEQVYFSNPVHNFLRGVTGGILMVLLSLFGFAYAIYTAAKNPLKRTPLALLLLAGVACFLSLALLIPLPFQRYTVLLVPFSTLWSVFLLNGLIIRLNKNREA
jgi:4-amino-4-deoxy-L-arabinose transferase-like glycosyltransferase